MDETKPPRHRRENHTLSAWDRKQENYKRWFERKENTIAHCRKCDQYAIVTHVKPVCDCEEPEEAEFYLPDGSQVKW